MSLKAGNILQLFREETGFISGEFISKELGVSRTAIWKHITSLRKEGYLIEAVPSRGYRIVTAPDLLDADSIKSQLLRGVFGQTLLCNKLTVSTNVDAFRLAEEGAAEGTIVLAEAQTGGKGRRGRIWSSPSGVNIYCSVVLRPLIMPHEAPQLTFLSAVAVARAIEITTPLKPEIKWPNDVLIAGKKVAGLLNEMSAETDGINFVILGIGVNLNMSDDQFPRELRNPATSLMLETGSIVDRSRFTSVMLNELEKLYTDFQVRGFAKARLEWQQRCNANGRFVTVSDSGADIVSGMFTGIDEDGALLVQSGEGRIERILSGDVRVI